VDGESTEQVVHVGYTSSAEVALKAGRLYRRTLNRDRRQRWRTSLFLVVLLAPMVVSLFLSTEVFYFAAGQIVFLSVATWLLFTGPLGKAKYRRDYRRKYGNSVRMDWRVTPQSLHVADEKETTFGIRWALLDKVVRTPTGFLVCVNATIVHWLPFTGFTSLADIEQVARWAKENAPLYIEAVDKDVR
jgi:hypothetical protein